MSIDHHLKSRLADSFLIFLFFCLGMYLVPLRMMHFDLSFIPGNLGDARLNNYFLEHGYKWLIGQAESFWNAPFFFPTPRTMSLSDNHLGTMPIYALFRILHLDRETSYQLWFLVVFALNYFSCAWVLRKLSVNALGIAAGTFVFTFSLPVIARMGHSQLLPRFMIPFAFYFGFRYIEKPDPKTFGLLCLTVVIEFYCTIYMGFFLFFALFFQLLAFFLIDRSAILRKILSLSYRTITLKALIVFISLVSLLPLIIPYYRTSLEYGMRPWEVIVQMLPRINSYFYPAGASLMWDCLKPLGRSLPLSWEHQIFVGALPWLALISFPVFYYYYREEPLLKIGMMASITIALLILFTLYFGYSFYKFFLYMPGISAIRAVTRIILVLLFPFSIVLGIVLTKLSENKTLSAIPRWARIFFCLFFSFAVLIDQSVIFSNSDTYSKTESQNRLTAVERLVKKDSSLAKVFAYMPNKSSDPAYIIHLDAMLAGQNLNMASVNGYSGNLPNGYYNTFYGNYDQCVGLMAWKEISTRRYGHFISEAYSFKNIVIAGRESCLIDNHSYTFTTAPLPMNAYKAKIIIFPPRFEIPRGNKFKLSANLTNASHVTWGSLNNEQGKYMINLSYRWTSSDHKPISGFDSRHPLPHDLRPGERVLYDLTINSPAIPGTYYLEFDVVQELVTFFHHKGSPTTLVKVVVL
jgi:hypothetical protein